MTKRKIIKIICIAIAVLLFVVPIPAKLNDGGTLHLKPIVPIYEIYISNTEIPGENGSIIYKTGYEVYLSGMEIYEKNYYTTEMYRQE